MHYASIENISKSFGVRVLFNNISFHVEEGDKIAFIARNGSGKSTLLKIIAGLDTADSGTVWVNKNVKVIMLQQDTFFREEKSIWDNILRLDNPIIRIVKAYEQYLEKPHDDDSLPVELMAKMDEHNAWNFESELKQILGRLQLHDLDTTVKNLSGGQRKRVALAQSLIEARLHEGRCLLILDEPTNHLDVDMIEWLEDFLSAHKLTLLLVTHDRYFLDAVCNEIIEMEDERLYVYNGDYDYFLEQKSLRQEVQLSELQKDKNIYRKELEWMRKQPKARTTKSKSRQDSFADIEQRAFQRKEDTAVSLRVKMSRLGGKILEMKKVYKSYGDKIILKGFDYTFKRGERIGIIGKNGCGKSTFLKIALQQELPDSGKINHGNTVVFGNFNQEGLLYKEDKRAIDYVKEFAEFFPVADGSKISASQFMEKFGFAASQQYTPLSILSGGEKRRLHLLSILFLNPNFLMLDEPTNDLDLQTLRTLEEFLLDFPGCILIVSHDRYFMDRMVDHLFAFEGNGIIKDFPGNYTLYRESLDTKTLAGTATVENSNWQPVVVQTQVKNGKQKLSYKEKAELEKIDRELPMLQEEKRSLEEKMSGNPGYDELQKAAVRVSAIIETIEEKEMRWLELSERI